MRGFPKKLSTGKDLLNCLALVQAGELPACELRERIAAIEEREHISIPILYASEDKRTVIVMSCSELSEGVIVKNANDATITEVQAAAQALSESEQQETNAICNVTLSHSLTESESVLQIASPASPYEAMGITKNEVSAIKEVLKNYE